jgi:MFS family permease
VPVPRLGRTVVALGVVSFFTDVSSEMIYPLLPVFLTATLGASAATLGAIEGAAESTAALLKLASGWWSDRLRRRKPLVVAGYALSSLARPLVAIAQSAGQVLAIRLTDRVGKGIRSAPRDALIADSVDASMRGRAFGFHRAADHAGAVVGPLTAYALLQWAGVEMRAVFWLAAIPAVAAVIAVTFFVREPVRPAPLSAPAGQGLALSTPLPRRYWGYLVILLVFTLGNSADAFLLLRAQQLGVPIALLPILWATLHVVKSAASMPGGALSDRVGRLPVLVAGWLVFAAVYVGFAFATDAWHAWVLFLAYGAYFALTEGPERALVADLVPADRRGAAFGWFNLTIGLAALPASLLFGLIWDARGASAAFLFGSALALAAAVALVPLSRYARRA